MENPRQPFGRVKCKDLFGETLARYASPVMPTVSGINHDNGGMRQPGRPEHEREQEEQRSSRHRQIRHRVISRNCVSC